MYVGYSSDNTKLLTPPPLIKKVGWESITENNNVKRPSLYYVKIYVYVLIYSIKFCLLSN